MVPRGPPGLQGIPGPWGPHEPRAVLEQNRISRAVEAQLNLTMVNQQKQTKVIADIMEESRIQRHDRMFQNIWS